VDNTARENGPACEQAVAVPTRRFTVDSKALRFGMDSVEGEKLAVALYDRRPSPRSAFRSTVIR